MIGLQSRARVMVIAAFLLAPGCLGPDNGLNPDASRIAPGKDFVVRGWTMDTELDLARGVAGLATTGDLAVPEWGNVLARFESKVGSWLVFYQPLTAPTHDLAYAPHFNLEVNNPGPEPGWVFVVPVDVATAVPDDANRSFEVGPFADPTVVVVEPGANFSYQQPAGPRGGSYGPGALGFLAAVATNLPWTMDVGVTIDPAGNSSIPWFVSAGENARIYSGGGQLAPAALPAGRAVLSGQVETPGWTHIQAMVEKVQPVGVRSYNITLPGNVEYSGVGVGYGYDLPTGGSAFRTGKVDYVGVMNGGSGDLRASIEYVEAVVGLNLLAIHIPMGSLRTPPGASGGIYSGFSEYFTDNARPVDRLSVGGPSE